MANDKLVDGTTTTIPEGGYKIDSSIAEKEESTTTGTSGAGTAFPGGVIDTPESGEYDAEMHYKLQEVPFIMPYNKLARQLDAYNLTGKKPTTFESIQHPESSWDNLQKKIIKKSSLDDYGCELICKPSIEYTNNRCVKYSEIRKKSSYYPVLTIYMRCCDENATCDVKMYYRTQASQEGEWYKADNYISVEYDKTINTIKNCITNTLAEGDYAYFNGDNYLIIKNFKQSDGTTTKNVKSFTIWAQYLYEKANIIYETELGYYRIDAPIVAPDNTKIYAYGAAINISNLKNILNSDVYTTVNNNVSLRLAIKIKDFF